jgi:hypothetical protein
VTSRLRDTGRAARTAFLGLSSVALGAALFAAPALPAAAEPALTVAEARSQIAQLQEDAEVLDQDYLAVKEQVDEAKAKLVLKQ